MSSSLAVVATATGGSSEILRNEVNSLVFPKADAEACADQVMRLLESPELFEELRRNGRRTVEGDFRLDDMVNRIDSSLTRIRSRVVATN
jgi:glycosyltransferase involved in cell wall biosynthesis